MPQEYLIAVFSRASNLLKGSQDIEDKERLLACAQIVIKRLSGMQIHDRNFTFYGAVHELEEKLIKQALELEGGNVSRAAERLRLKRQTLANMLRDRHKKLFDKRTPPNVGVVHGSNGGHVRTYADGQWNDNLLALIECVY